MARKTSNRERIARKAAEKAAERKEKEAAKGGGRKVSRVRLVWVVCDHAGSPVKEFPYPEKEEAQAEAARLTEKKGKLHFVKKDKTTGE